MTTYLARYQTFQVSDLTDKTILVVKFLFANHVLFSFVFSLFFSFNIVGHNKT